MYSNNFYVVKNKFTGKIYKSIYEIYNSKELYSDLEFIIDNNKWSLINWQIEPRESFRNLLIQRAKQLRDKYKYLTLYYSGGSDSETMIQSFILANVYPDEIVLNIQLINNKNPILDTDFAISKLQFYKNFLKNTKITINYLDRDSFITFLKKNPHDTFIGGAINAITRQSNISLVQANLLKNNNIINSGHIMGEFKPQIYVLDNKFYSTILPTVTTGHYNDFFFTSIDLPELHIKQNHLVKNYFKIRPHLKPEGFIGDSNPIWRKHLQTACRFRFDDRYELSKSSGIGKDFLKSENNECTVLYNELLKYDKELYDCYYQCIKEILQSANPKSINLKKINFHGIHSATYYLGE